VHACNAALSAAIAAREGVVELNKHRAAKGKPLTDMYLGLHVGNVFYGNVVTVLGPAVNEASRIAAMCRSVDQPVLISTAFAEVGNIRHRLVSVGRYALRGVSIPRSCLRSIRRLKSSCVVQLIRGSATEKTFRARQAAY